MLQCVPRCTPSRITSKYRSTVFSVSLRSQFQYVSRVALLESAFRLLRQDSFTYVFIFKNFRLSFNDLYADYPVKYAVCAQVQTLQ
jgi:hypothetical protein